MKPDWIERDYQMTNPTGVVRKLTVSQFARGLSGTISELSDKKTWLMFFKTRGTVCLIIDSEFLQARVELTFFQKQFHRLYTISFEPVSHLLKSVRAIANLLTDLCPNCRILHSKQTASFCPCRSARSSGLLQATRRSSQVSVIYDSYCQRYQPLEI